jgi:hypothetical protein
VIWWQDVETSTVCYYQQQFQLTNITKLLFVIFIFSFLPGFGCGLTVIKTTTSSNPDVSGQAMTTLRYSTIRQTISKNSQSKKTGSLTYISLTQQSI